jgi:internalin A
MATRAKSKTPKTQSLRHEGVKWNTKTVRADGMSLTEIPEELFTNLNLEYLALSGNLLTSLPDKLWTLPNLSYVFVLGNPIESLPDRPGIFIDLPTFFRCHAQQSAGNWSLFVSNDNTPEDIDRLLAICSAADRPLLAELFLGSWTLPLGRDLPGPGPVMESLIDHLPAFAGLRTLTLRGMKLDAAPECILRMGTLKDLRLEGLQLKGLPDWIARLDLETFSAVGNGLTTLPDRFSDLIHLKLAHLSYNAYEQIPEVLFGLPSLEALYMDNCQLRVVPPDILRLKKLKRFSFGSGSTTSPPAEIAKKGLGAIRAYWRQQATQGVDYLCEAKLIVLGEAGAGKTSLARKIQNPGYLLKEREKSTEGIDVIRFVFPSVFRTRGQGQEQILQRDFQVNIWDFGGQEIYHATHQFFLTKRSVYVLVCDDRKEDADFDYWLQTVEMLSDASPLFIVQNEKQDRKRDINLTGLRARFANLRDALPTNLDNNRGLDRVLQAIKKELESLPHIGVGLPATWKPVREALEQAHKSNDYISLEEYLRICQDHGFASREDKLQLSGYLHDLGICLHFQEDPLLKNTVILRPSWGTDAVYRVLDDTEVIAAGGQFTRRDLGRIWHEPGYAGMQDELLRLMMKFQLCYALETEDAYIAPQLLSSEQPAYPWDPGGGMVVRYEYEFLPKGILTRFIVAMHRMITSEKLVWKTGVVLARDGSRAEITEEYSQKRIRVRLNGRAAQGLFAVIDEQLERLHASFSRLKYERYLPCPCNECRNKPEPYGFAVSKLLKMIGKRQPIQCYESGEMVDAAALIREILPGLCEQDDSVMLARPGMTQQATPPPPVPEVFVSYAWTKESTAIVDRLETVLGERDIHLLRDRQAVGYKDSIRDFMQRIGRGKCVVVVVSEKYLKSENCMFEMLAIAREKSLRERIFPIVLADANIYRATGRAGYVRHWEQEFRTLDDALKTIRGDNVKKLQEDLNLYADIRRLVDEITDVLRDMNALTPEQHEGTGFDQMIERIRAALGA